MSSNSLNRQSLLRRGSTLSRVLTQRDGLAVSNAAPESSVRPRLPPPITTEPGRTVSGALYSPQTEQRAYRELQDSYYETHARAECTQRSSRDVSVADSLAFRERPDFEKTAATLYNYLPPAAHLRYLDSRLTEDALAPALRASVAETRKHVVEQLRRESVTALQIELSGLIAALEEEHVAPDANASFDNSR